MLFLKRFLALILLIGLFIFSRYSRMLSQATPSSAGLPPATPDLRILYNQAQQSNLALTLENIQEERQIFDKQVATAQQWLNDSRPQRRIAGAEQLAAYPTPEAEISLNEVLLNDIAAKVRAAAALSLSGFQQLTDGSIVNLLDALGDENQEVQLQALHTLSRYLLKQLPQSEVYRHLVQSLEQKSQSDLLSAVTIRALKALLDDIKGDTFPKHDKRSIALKAHA